MNWSDTVLSKRVGIRYPIIQAPIVENSGKPELTAAISNAGGLGCLSGVHLSVESLQQAITEVRALTSQPFAINLAATVSTRVDHNRFEHGQALLAPFRSELGLSEKIFTPLAFPDLAESLEVILAAQIPVVIFSFGLPEPEYQAILQEAGIVVIGMATHLLEAIVLEESGVDFIIAQGAEAGGHRSTFIGHPEQGLIGTMVLTPLIAKHVATPIIATGGIMDGRGIAAALMLGAAGVQMGTAFLACPESGTHPAYKALLLEGNEVATTLSRVFTGRYGRVLRNRLTEALRPHQTELPGFPLQLLLTQELRQAAAEENIPDFMALWAGQGCHLCEERPVNQLLTRWVAQVDHLLGTEGD